MGNTSSQPARSSDANPSRSRGFRPFASPRGPAEDGRDVLLNHGSRERDGQARHSTPQDSPSHTGTARRQFLASRSEQRAEGPAHSHVLQRARGSIRDLLSREHSLRRRLSQGRYSRLGQVLPQSRTSQFHATSGRDLHDEYQPPRLPSIDVNSTFTDDAVVFTEEVENPPRSSHSARRSNLRFNPLRSDRPFRHLTSSLRRRRSPQAMDSMRRSARDSGGEDQATMLSRLLSIAAAATAATLMGDDPQALSEARTLSGGAGMGDFGSSGEDGSFDGFLRALQNGRIASALREGADSDNTSREGPLNFFRMFRFGASAPSNDDPDRDTANASAGGGPDATEGRMVPIIIVGIRSISPGSGSGPSSPADDLPPFIDSLGNFPSPLPANALGQHGHDSIDSILRPPQNGTSFRHRRRASLGGFGMSRSRLSERLHEHREQSSTDRRRERPWSVASSSSALEPRPPPATPASPSPELSRIASRSSTPVHSRPASFIASSIRDSPGTSRRSSVMHRATAASTLSAHTEESRSMASNPSAGPPPSAASDADSPHSNPHRRSDTIPNVHYPRFASGHPRRNGVVEPDHLPALSTTSSRNGTDGSTLNDEARSDSRSWIIYVLGGSYPENHPILTTPSLFTENPTYEDMMLLSALLGPAKAPVASEEDVESAGGIYSIVLRSDPTQDEDRAKTAALVAVATETEDRVDLDAGQRCLVCLCDFEVDEAARKLAKCNHLFHKECIDQWLTQGRNSCPLCRAQGVDVSKTEDPQTPETDHAVVDNAESVAAGDSVEFAG